MINTILQKVLDEFNKDVPRLDYIRGMVETLISYQPQAIQNQSNTPVVATTVATVFPEPRGNATIRPHVAPIEPPKPRE